MIDVIVIGGGTSGLMAAVSAAQHGARVLILDKNPNLGRKLLLTGGTRCNVTNIRPVEDIIQHIPGNGKFLFSAFAQFNNQDIIHYFQSRGVTLKEEDHGRLFPTTDSAKTILNTFINDIKALRIKVQTNLAVTHILTEDGQISGVEVETGEQFFAKAVILATGGKSYPKTGSTGDGYRLAKQLGHTITELFATEVPLTSNEDFIKDKTLRALSLRDIALSVLNQKGKAVITHQMDMIFTHFGISGPAVLRCSSFVHLIKQRDKTENVTMKLNALPNKTVTDLREQWAIWQQTEPQKSIKQLIKQWVPERYGEFLISKCNLSPQSAIQTLSLAQRDALLELLQGFTFTVNGSLPIEKGFVTGGGISTKEIQPKTMESRRVSGLFFCGEVMDIHGYTGGYNITAAFVTGHTAGRNAADYALENSQ